MDDERQAPPDDPVALAAGMVRLLDVEPTGENQFRGRRKVGGTGRIFGGQVIGQALMAATKTVDPSRAAHSLHAYFMRPGDENHPIDFRVWADFDGGTFSNRRVVALQKDKPILNLAASFQVAEEGMEHSIPMPDVPPPEDLPSQADVARANPQALPPAMYEMLTRPNAVEQRPIGPPLFFPQPGREPVMRSWFRTVAPLDAGPEIQRAALAMMSDYVLLGTALRPHDVTWANLKLQTASIDHAFWLHSEPRLHEWMLYTTESPWAGNARGLSRGSIYSRDGTLIASGAQEGLIRRRGDGLAHRGG